MYEGRFVFSQIMDPLPWHIFEHCVRRYNGNYRVRTFSCAQQFRVMAIAQLTQRTSLRDIIICLKTQREKLYHLGIAGGVSLSALAKANEFRSWHMLNHPIQQSRYAERANPASCNLALTVGQCCRRCALNSAVPMQSTPALPLFAHTRS